MDDGNWTFFKGLILGVYLSSSWVSAMEVDCKDVCAEISVAQTVSP